MFGPSVKVHCTCVAQLSCATVAFLFRVDIFLVRMFFPMLAYSYSEDLFLLIVFVRTTELDFLLLFEANDWTVRSSRLLLNSSNPEM